MKRIFLFVVTNIAVLVLATLVFNLLGFDGYLTERGINPVALLVFAALFGFGGAFVSLAVSKWVAIRAMNVQVIKEPRTQVEMWLVNTVKAHADRAGIGMPDVGIFQAPEVNAFATGARRDSALVAVSSGLLAALSKNEAEAVIGHEVSHVANGDMVTMTLLQGVLNTFVIFLSRVAGTVVDQMLRGQGDRGGPGPAYLIVTIVSQIVFGILASMIVMWFSRRREFRADAGGAQLAGSPNMIAALQKLLVQQRKHVPAHMPQQFRAFGIYDDARRGLKRLFMSHPPLEERISALQASPIT
jgi:heat shock protein HtpX